MLEKISAIVVEIEFVNAYLLLSRSSTNTAVTARDRLNYVLDHSNSTPGREKKFVHSSRSHRSLQVLFPENKGKKFSIISIVFTRKEFSFPPKSIRISRIFQLGGYRQDHHDNNNTRGRNQTRQHNLGTTLDQARRWHRPVRSLRSTFFPILFSIFQCSTREIR